jgi:hypothetical protein
LKRLLTWSALALLPLAAAARVPVALAQDGVTPKTVAAPKPANPAPAPAAATPAPGAVTDPQAPEQPPAPPQGGTQLVMRGLDKITGRPTSITAAIGKPVHFATLTITARYCYSTPPSETPETAAFVQIEDHRPDQPARRVFSGWMYASSPGLNAVEHPLYDVWVISCNNAPASAVAANTSAAPAKVKAPDSSDKEGIQALPEGAGQ